MNTVPALQKRPRGRLRKVDSSLDMDKIGKTEAIKKVPASLMRKAAGHVGTVNGNRRRTQSTAVLPSRNHAVPVAVRASKTLKRARLQPKQDDDIENVIRAQMMKEAKTSRATSTNMSAPVGSAPVGSHNGMEASVSISQVQGVPVICNEHAATVAARINALSKDKFS